MQEEESNPRRAMAPMRAFERFALHHRPVKPGVVVKRGHCQAFHPAAGVLGSRQETLVTGCFVQVEQPISDTRGSDGIAGVSPARVQAVALRYDPAEHTLARALC